MKKQLFLLPLLAGLALGGCSLFGGGDNEEKLPSHFLNEFQGYKLAKSVKDGGRYLLGVYRYQEDWIRFADGEWHTDEKGYYPFYMSTVKGTVEGAAEIEVKMISDDEFTMQVFAEGKHWHQKYIGVYAAKSSYDNDVMSIALIDDPAQETYTDPKSGSTFSFSTTFKFYTKYNGDVVYAPAAPFMYPDVDPEPVPKFLGTGHISETDKEAGKEDYTSIDCKSYEVALDYISYDLAHLYEKK